MKKTQFLTLIASALESYDAYYRLAGPLAKYPITTFNLIDPSAGNAQATSFGAQTETYRVQLAVDHDQSDGIEQLSLLEDIEESFVEGLRGQDGIIRIQYAGSAGPFVQGSEREWRVTADYIVTTGRDAPIEGG